MVRCRWCGTELALLAESQTVTAWLPRWLCALWKLARDLSYWRVYAPELMQDRIVTTRENDTVIVKRTIGTPAGLNNARARQVICRGRRAILASSAAR